MVLSYLHGQAEDQDCYQLEVLHFEQLQDAFWFITPKHRAFILQVPTVESFSKETRLVFLNFEVSHKFVYTFFTALNGIFGNVALKL
jgi:hypothetical protein